jgi:predicted permease
MSTGNQRLRDALVISEVVLATVLLVIGGLLVRSVRNAESAGPGFRTDHITLAAFDLRTSGYDQTTAAEFFGQLAEKLHGMPGVEAVSMERYVPLWFTGRSYTPVQIEGYAPQAQEDMNIDLNVVGANYFQTLEIPIAEGRDFSERDRDGAPYVLIVNQTMAKRFWPGRPAVGRRVRLWGEWWTVAGVARDVKYHRMNEPPQPFLYLPELQAGGMDVNMLVRSQMATSAMVSAVRAATRSINAKVQPLETDDLRGLLHASLFANRTAASVATVLGVLGLSLAALGIYGVISYRVSQRLREIGIRMALGAQKADVLWRVISQGLTPVLLGLGAGIIGALGFTRLLSSLLFGVNPTDPLTFIVVSLILSGVAALASYIPARRAMKVDPMVALRYE